MPSFSVSDHNYHLYQEVLTSVNRGTALWEPSNEQLKIGDVGYLSFGTFIRLFNATLPIGHPDNQFGEPEGHRPLMLGSHQIHRVVKPPEIVSFGVHPIDLPSENCDTPLTFRCTSKVGALLITHDRVIAEDAINIESFRDYLTTHVQSWSAFAADLGRDVPFNEIIFVTGYDFTDGRYSVTVFKDACVSNFLKKDSFFQISRPSSKCDGWFHAKSIKCFHHNSGPWKSKRANLFVRGFRSLDASHTTLKANETDNIAIDEPDHHRGPLDAVLRYLADSSNAGIVVTHDTDLFHLTKRNVTLWNYQSVLRALRKGREPFVSGPVATLVC